MLRNYKFDSLSNIQSFLDPEKGLYHYFRTQSMEMQNRFTQVFSLNDSPLVFLHGNPHIDNYARTSTGCGMIDFDRSRIGPYAWDLVRFMSSLSLRQKKDSIKLSRDVMAAIKDAYITRIGNPDMGYTPYSGLTKQTPERWQMSTRNYIKSQKKWAKKMLTNKISPRDSRIQHLYEDYARSRNKQHHLKEFTIKEVGIAAGSLGKARFLVLLDPKDRKKDQILLDIKEVYNDPDTRYFYNPYVRQGHRMVEASLLYAPGVEQRVGYANLDGQEYWVRQIPAFQNKVKGNLGESEIEEFAYCVSSQLGIAHSRSLLFTRKEKLIAHTFENFNKLQAVSELLTKEVIQSHKEYKKQVKREITDLTEEAFG